MGIEWATDLKCNPAIPLYINLGAQEYWGAQLYIRLLWGVYFHMLCCKWGQPYREAESFISQWNLSAVALWAPRLYKSFP
ncbi:hypothetical protein XENTR_v10007366 [Xenopus tropicalis]|nr:hypothetical protein XENTR_v10007366 [Xenopus tropicalis]